MGFNLFVKYFERVYNILIGSYENNLKSQHKENKGLKQRIIFGVLVSAYKFEG